jgi:ribonuclease R
MPYEALITKMTLRSMQQARYATECIGHFGLACKYYCHFTSPIRRYPDLIVHRLIDKYNNNLDLNQLENIERSLPEICEQSSYMEREADEAEKETGELMMVHFALDHIGHSYRGKIIAFNNDSMTVKLDNNVKGIVQNNLNPKLKRKKQYRIGQTVYAVIKEVSVPHRVIYFGLESKEKKQRKKLIKK